MILFVEQKLVSFNPEAILGFLPQFTTSLFAVTYFPVLASDIFALSRCLFSKSAIAFFVFDITFVLSAVFDFAHFKIVVCS